jgi:hypothetical protein
MSMIGCEDTRINPDSMNKNPDFSQLVIVADAEKIVSIRSGYAAVQRLWGAHTIAMTFHIVDSFGALRARGTMT